MKILVPVKRVVDYNVKIRVKSDGSGVDLLITDIIMPKKEGLQVLMELRKVQPPVKIIAISGGGRKSSADYLQIAKLMGAGRVLAKPFSNEELVAAIEELLGGGATAEPAAVS